ncbi:MAG TPA: bifunctional adenosylcobinamide kinase/adenosylcobinamide-phosphate guanylyltransferase [Polyangia bacterium]
MFTFVTGGLCSGKSAYALRRATELGPPPWLYVSSDVEGDEALKNRLASHRRDQESIWRVKDAPTNLEDLFVPEIIDRHGALVLDKFSLWMAGRVTAAPAGSERELLHDVERLSDRLYRSAVPSVVVTTEVGLGFLPTVLAERPLIELLGRANQILAERAASVVFMASGVAQRLR